MSALPEYIINCPYCNESNEILIEPCDGQVQDYIEDCQICCRPIHLIITSHNHDIYVQVKSEDET
ncbi:MAG: CPXCG motif-containing cysteine-rich protein [Gammaproteobacteria bacterium]|nr:CPXCG motif-containing cysteine-rich protein [Gammaproteobacteria bacterium]